MLDMTTELENLQPTVDARVQQLTDAQIVERIWARDHTVWKPDPDEISNRLGWLDIAQRMSEELGCIDELVHDVREAGYRNALLLGMGGSSLAPETFRKIFGVHQGYLDLHVLDSTDPAAVQRYAKQLNPSTTLYIVATKSGGTTETLSFFKFFYNQTVEAVGREKAGAHFTGITDPGSKLKDLGEQYDFRATFLNDSEIGGRYSALSYFGLVPAALIGIDVPRLLENAMNMARRCRNSGGDSGAAENPGAHLGAILGELAQHGRDKLTLITSPAFDAFGAWAEQLIAESTGKEGKGILPVDGERLLAPEGYGDDRLFVQLHVGGENSHGPAVHALKQAGQPVVQLHLDGPYDLGGEYFRWEFATAVAGHVLDINPFDQPNVESAKNRAREMTNAYQESGQLPALEPTLEAEGITVYADDSLNGSSPRDLLVDFLQQADSGDGQGGGNGSRSYVALQAYVTPTAETDRALQNLRTQIQEQGKMATTVGYGPRFLHSTGQLHKGDGGNGLFIQFTSNPTQTVNIPDAAGDDASSMTFGVLIAAQALGDRQALLDNDRRVIRFDLGEDVVGGLNKLMG